MSISMTTFNNFQKQIINAMAMIDRKVTYLYKNTNTNDKNFGFHNTNPQFTVDVTGTINTSIDYYRKGQLLLPAGTLIQFAGTIIPGGWLLCDGSSLLIENYQELFNMIGTTYGSIDEYHFNLPNFSGRVPVGSGGGYNVGQSGGEATHTLTESEMPSHVHTGAVNPDGIHNHLATSDMDGLHRHNGRTENNGTHTHTSNSTSTTGILPTTGFGTGTDFDIGPSTEPNIQDTPIQLVINNAGEHNHLFETSYEGTHNHAINVFNSSTHSHTFTTNSTGGGTAHNNMQPYVVIQYLIKY